MEAPGDEAPVSQASDEQLSIDVFIPELQIQKCMQFAKAEKIWDVKQLIITSLPKELKDSFNYGLYCPPSNGRAGKYLDEERSLGEYSLTGHPPLLELRYKRRVYKMAHMEEKQLKQIHSRANIRRFVDAVQNGNIEKITKMCTRGLDPNFHCNEAGETPLTLAAGTKQTSGKVIMALVNGGALLDFRAKDGHTALHRAVEQNNLEALTTLLDLGASPNYKDPRGLTPLYHTVVNGNTDPRLTEVLLHDHAELGTADHQGWQEVHQACKHGLVQHLEHLLYYGADLNARNASGNTPLHVCAVNDRESCARVLLFRGADKEALNFAHQTPYQVAVIAGNLALAELIQAHRQEDVVPYREAPQYNPRRRPTMGRTHSDPRLDMGAKPPSPCPSNCSLPPFSSGSTMSDTSSSHASTEDSSMLDGGSESSGVCSTEPDESIILSGTSVVCIEDYDVPVDGHLKLKVGDVIEVTVVHSDGLLEGISSEGQEGFFPVSCVQPAKHPPGEGESRVEGRREINAKQGAAPPASLHRKWKMYGEPKTVILHKGKKGFGFVLRGAKATSPLMERQPSDNWPSLQYLEDVDTGGIADLAGLKKGDFLMEINGQDVSQASHEHVVSLIRQAGDMIAMTVITVPTPVHKPTYRQCATLPRKLSSKKAPAPPKRDPRTTLTVGRTRARSMVAGLAEIEALDRTLNDYDSEGRSTKSSSVESISNKPQQDGGVKVASIRSRPSSRRISSQELEEFFSRQGSRRQFATQPRQGGGPRVFGSVAAMKRSKASKMVDVVRRLHKHFHSTPDLNTDVSDEEDESAKYRCYSQENLHIPTNNRHSWAFSADGTSGSGYKDSWKTLEDNRDGIQSEKIYAQTLPLKKRVSCPPPTHPPPPPPVGQVVKVDVSKTSEDYANMQIIQEETSVMSSFRPGDSAKLYASPEVIVSVGYKAEASPKVESPHVHSHYSPATVRSRSVPPPTTKPLLSSETETSGDSGVNYMAFRKSGRQRESLSSDSGHVSEKGGTLKSLKTKTVVYTPQFERDDSDSSSPQRYRNPEPFIPEPDYESSEEDDIPQDHSSSLSTFGKADSVIEIVPESKREEKPDNQEELQRENIKTRNELDEQIAALNEAQKACQEARERLRQAKIEKSSGERRYTTKVEIKNEEPRQERVESPLKPIYMEPQVQETSIGTKKNIDSKEELIKESGIGSENIFSPKDFSHPLVKSEPNVTFEIKSKDSSQQTVQRAKENYINIDKNRDHSPTLRTRRKKDGLRIALTGAQIKLGSNSEGANLPFKIPANCPKGYFQDELERYENSSSGVSSDIEVDHERYRSNLEQNGRIDPTREQLWNRKNLKETELLQQSRMLAKHTKHSYHISLPGGKENTMARGGSPRREKRGESIEGSKGIESTQKHVRLQVDSLGRAGINEVDVLTQLVPPPPEFAASTSNEQQVQSTSSTINETIAPPPGFSDDSPPASLQGYASLRHPPDAMRYMYSKDFQHPRTSTLHFPTKTPSSTCIKTIRSLNQQYPSSLLQQTSAPSSSSSKKSILFYPDPVSGASMGSGGAQRLKTGGQKSFRLKPLHMWTEKDVCDWLESLYLSEYQARFAEAGITGMKLAKMDNNDLVGLGVRQVGHRINMERSLRRYLKATAT